VQSFIGGAASTIVSSNLRTEAKSSAVESMPQQLKTTLPSSVSLVSGLHSLPFPALNECLFYVDDVCYFAVLFKTPGYFDADDVRCYLAILDFMQSKHDTV